MLILRTSHLSLFESQNHYFQTKDENNYSLISLGTQLISSIAFNDTSSFLRQEIPGCRFLIQKFILQVKVLILVTYLINLHYLWKFY